MRLLSNFHSRLFFPRKARFIATSRPWRDLQSVYTLCVVDLDAPTPEENRTKRPSKAGPALNVPASPTSTSAVVALSTPGTAATPSSTHLIPSSSLPTSPPLSASFLSQPTRANPLHFVPKDGTALQKLTGLLAYHQALPLEARGGDIINTVSRPTWKLYASLSSSERASLSPEMWEHLWTIQRYYQHPWHSVLNLRKLYEARFSKEERSGQASTKEAARWGAILFESMVSCCEWKFRRRTVYSHKRAKMGLYFNFLLMDELFATWEEEIWKRQKGRKKDFITRFLVVWTKIAAHLPKFEVQSKTAQRFLQVLERNAPLHSTTTGLNLDSLSDILNRILALYISTSDLQATHEMLLQSLSHGVAPSPSILTSVTRRWGLEDVIQIAPALTALAKVKGMSAIVELLMSRVRLVEAKGGDLRAEVERLLGSGVDGSERNPARDVYTQLLARLYLSNDLMEPEERWDLALKVYDKMIGESITPDALVHETMINLIIEAFPCPTSQAYSSSVATTIDSPPPRHSSSSRPPTPLGSLLKRIIPHFYLPNQPWNIPTIRWQTHVRLFKYALHAQDVEACKILYSLIKARELEQEEQSLSAGSTFVWTFDLALPLDWLFRTVSKDACSGSTQRDNNFNFATQLYFDALADGCILLTSSFAVFLKAIGQRGDVDFAVKVISDFMQGRKERPSDGIMESCVTGFLQSANHIPTAIRLIQFFEHLHPDAVHGGLTTFFTAPLSNYERYRSQQNMSRITRLPTRLYARVLRSLPRINVSVESQRRPLLLWALRLRRRIKNANKSNDEDVSVDDLNAMLTLFLTPSTSLPVTPRNMDVAWLLFREISQGPFRSQEQKKATFETLLEGLTRLSYPSHPGGRYAGELVKRWEYVRWILEEGFDVISGSYIKSAVIRMAAEGEFEMAKETSERWWKEVIRTEKLLTPQEERDMTLVSAAVMDLEQTSLVRKTLAP
ncbi:hypothetical protein BT69DRAFT_1334067 [Atractiella rhizophila]|nr:hypothetical protein BT69DRAFT_1334067 [Atractiella rhizophila]